MEALAVVVVAILNVALLAHHWRRWSAHEFWVSGATYYLAFGFLQYPLRGLVLLASRGNSRFDVYRVSEGEIARALVFYMAFTLVLIAAYDTVRVRRADRDGPKVGRGVASLMVLLVCYFAALCYRVYAGKVYTLYEDLTDLYGTFGDGLARLADRLKWLIVPWAAILYVRRRMGVALVALVAVVVACLAESVITTAKGDLVALGIMLLFLSAYFRVKVPKALVGAVVAVSVVFSVYSYLARDIGDVRGEFEVAKVIDSIEKVRAHATTSQEIGWVGIVNRFNYLDGLVLAMRRGPGGEPPYQAGSLVEIAMLVPRAIWQSRPHYSFNHHVTSAVWGESFFSETPIGRVGEAYYVLGWTGIVLAVLYGWAFAKIRQVIVRPATHEFGKAVAIYVSFVVVLPDAYLTYGWKTLVYLAPVVAGAWALYSREAGLLGRHPP